MLEDLINEVDPCLERTFRGHKGAVNCTAFNPNMKQVASGGDDNMVMVWNFKPSMRAFKFAGHKVNNDTRIQVHKVYIYNERVVVLMHMYDFVYCIGCCQ